MSSSLWCAGPVPQPGMEPASPALGGRFLTTRPQGNPKEDSVAVE